MLATEGNCSDIVFALLFDIPLTAHNMDCQVLSGVQLALFFTCVELEAAFSKLSVAAKSGILPCSQRSFIHNIVCKVWVMFAV